MTPAPHVTPNLQADLAACHAMLRTGSRSFFAAGLLLPRRVMQPAAALYAFCRVADDVVDNGDKDLAALRRRVDRIYAGMPEDHPEDRALAAIVTRHRLPRALLDQLLEGFAWDANGRRYEDLADLQAYAARVAGTVGAAMALLMGARDPARVARACDLGIAMQLSNIARDVAEDARAGRLYLPCRWLRENGVDPEAFLAAPIWSPGLARVVARLVATADTLYARADLGIAALPADCRPGIGAARRLYAAIGHRAAALGPDLLHRRAVVPARTKLALLAQATAAATRRRPAPTPAFTAPPIPAARHLLAAIAASPPPPPRPPRLVWVLELFAQLDSRQSPASAQRDPA